MNPRLVQLQKELAPLREQLVKHPLYERLQKMDDIRLFMQHHVFAVWDFMSLLKGLQQQLTGVTLPWLPSPHPTLARFINEIVLGEESDVNAQGEAQSHFELYLDAMQEAGANTHWIESFVKELHQGHTVQIALNNTNLPDFVRNFVHFTFETIATKEPARLAAAFTFGREEIIPDLFLAIIDQEQARQGEPAYAKLRYYLQRHIELDGDEHGPLSLQMVEALCGDTPEKWEAAKEAALQALQKRLELWDGIAALLMVAPIKQ
ncbi:MAG: DUF3050 domain-containing protein [Aureispira sp.]